MFEDDLKAELEVPLRNWAMRTQNSFEEYASRLSQRFPFSLNRIRWELVKGHVLLEALERLPGEDKKVDAYFLRAAPRIQDFVRRVFRQEQIDFKVEMVWLGDSLDFAWLLTGEVYLESCHVLLSYPQHSYLIPHDAAWCLNYTWEDDLFFGRALSSLAD